jgi:hypothetical protein
MAAAVWLFGRCSRGAVRKLKRRSGLTARRATLGVLLARGADLLRRTIHF